MALWTYPKQTFINVIVVFLGIDEFVFAAFRLSNTAAAFEEMFQQKRAIMKWFASLFLVARSGGSGPERVDQN